MLSVCNSRLAAANKERLYCGLHQCTTTVCTNVLELMFVYGHALYFYWFFFDLLWRSGDKNKLTCCSTNVLRYFMDCTLRNSLVLDLHQTRVVFTVVLTVRGIYSRIGSNCTDQTEIQLCILVQHNFSTVICQNSSRWRWNLWDKTRCNCRTVVKLATPPSLYEFLGRPLVRVWLIGQ